MKNLLTISALLWSSLSGFCEGKAFLLVGIGWSDPAQLTNVYSYDSRGHIVSSEYYSPNSPSADACPLGVGCSAKDLKGAYCPKLKSAILATPNRDHLR